MDTRPEIALRSTLHRAGLRFRKDLPVRIDGSTIRPDVVFTRRRVAVFVDGCFWHRCPIHGRVPGGPNAQYWEAKLNRNHQRDIQQTRVLQQAGWTVIRIWEHESVEDAAARIIQVIQD